MIRDYEAHWFPLIRPKIRALFSGGDGIGGVPLGSHENSLQLHSLKLTASLHLKMDGKGRLSRFLFGFRSLFSGANP